MESMEGVPKKRNIMKKATNDMLVTATYLLYREEVREFHYMVQFCVKRLYVSTKKWMVMWISKQVLEGLINLRNVMEFENRILMARDWAQHINKECVESRKDYEAFTRFRIGELERCGGQRKVVFSGKCSYPFIVNDTHNVAVFLKSCCTSGQMAKKTKNGNACVKNDLDLWTNKDGCVRAVRRESIFKPECRLHINCAMQHCTTQTVYVYKKVGTTHRTNGTIFCQSVYEPNGHIDSMIAPTKSVIDELKLLKDNMVHLMYGNIFPYLVNSYEVSFRVNIKKHAYKRLRHYFIKIIRADPDQIDNTLHFMFKHFKSH